MSLCAGSLLLGACAGKGEQKMSVSQEPDTLLMLVGSYASADQEGIKTYRFNQETGEAVLASTLSGIENPSFFSADGRRYACVCRGRDGKRVYG